jgi:hypothetical protein
VPVRVANPPLRVRWNTTAAAEGTHRLAVTARTAGGRRGSARLDVVVANADSLPVSLRAAWGRPVDGWPAAAG